MKVLVIGSGGREHALSWKLGKSPKLEKLYCAPGNGGTAGIAANIPVKAEDIKSLLEFCKNEKIDFTVVGPEAPLAAGIVDEFRKEGLRIFGPDKKAALLESSKIFTKELCRSENIPTAEFEVFSDYGRAAAYIRRKGAPIVVKADGLAAGKGVVVARTEAEALEAAERILVKKEFGVSGERLIVEKCLEGEEASIIVVSDGENVVPLASSQDHKRIFDCDKGPNTGGMGAYSPAPVVTDRIFEETVSDIIIPAIKGMKKRGSPVTGVLYAGIMVTDKGPELLEFNVRFGDPETEAILPRMDSDLLELLLAASDGSLKDYKPAWSEKACVSVVIASGGYPGKYEKGKAISGINRALETEDTLVFHAGTKLEKGRILTSGGRVLNVVSSGSDIKEAIDRAYKACGVIRFEGMHYRKDIGSKALKKEELSC